MRLKLLLAAFMFAAPLSAQSGVPMPPDTIQGDSARVTIILQGTFYRMAVDTLRGPYKAGDTVQISASAFDENNDPVSALFSFTAQDPTILRIDTVTVPGVGRAIAHGTILQKLRGVDHVYVLVHVEQVDTIITGWLDQTHSPPIVDFSKHDLTNPTHVALQQARQLCTYLLYQNRIVTQNPGSPGMPCPIITSPISPAVRGLDPLPYYREWIALARGVAGHWVNAVDHAAR